MSQTLVERPKRGKITKWLSEPGRSKGLTKLIPKYAYEPLSSPTSIRVLRLLPGTGQDAIECQLYETALDEAQQYEALSYAWGDLTDKTAILCRGRRMTIPTNLCDFLQRLRSPIEARTLWADVICINQRDPKETMHQVQQMASIYSFAERVLIWLGLEDPFEFLREDEQPLELIHCLLERRNENNNEESSRTITVNSGTSLDKDLVWRSFTDLLDADWFFRLWVLQEAGLARTALAMFGARVVDFDELIGTARRIHRERFDLAVHYNIRDPLASLSSFPQRRPASFSQDYITYDFLELVYGTVNKLASDPRDFIFALLGHPLAQTGGSLIIEPDYEKTPQEIYHEVALKLLRQSQDLRVLSAVWHYDQADVNNGEPSWVPTWRRQVLTINFGIFMGYRGILDADAGIPRSLHFLESGNVLQVQGFKLNKIKGYTKTFAEFHESPSAGHTDIADWPLAEALALSSVPETSTPDKLLELAHALLGGFMGLEELGQRIQDFAALRVNIWNETAEQTCERLHDLLPDGLEAARELARGGDAQSFLNDACCIMSSKRIFVTETGLLGSGPPVLRTGDICCILFGAAVPFILRPVGSGYRLIGEAFIPQVRQGEAVVDWMLGEKYLEQMFEIF